MGGASTKNTDGTTTKLNATQFAALGEPAITVSDLYSMDVYRGATGDYIYKDSSGTSYFVDDDGDVQSLTKQQADSLVLPDTKKYTGTLDPVEIIGSRYKESLGYDWFPDQKTTTAQSTSNLLTLTTKDIGALTTKDTGALTTKDTGALTTKDTGTLTTTSPTAVTTGPATLTSNQINTLTTTALTTTDPRGLQVLPTSDARYWRQTGAQGTGGKGGVRFFDWYDTPENRTMAPNAMATQNIPAITSEQAKAITAPAAKQYYNQSTNRYYTDPTGTWQPPAGWTQTGLKGGGKVKTKHFDGGGYADYDLGIKPYTYADFDIPINPGYDNDLSGYNFADFDMGISPSGGDSYGSAAEGIFDFDTGRDTDEYLRSLPSDNASYGGGKDQTARYEQEIKDASKTGVPNKPLSGSNALKNLADAAKKNPDLMKMLLAAGLGGIIGYAGRPKGFNPKGMQGLGLTQSQVHGALKGKPVQRAMGGEIGSYAGGGGLHYLKSAEDGMADKIPATIDNKQPAKLSGGEFVIPADVVSHLGNGNSEAGAKQLYAMMDRIRHARTGNKKQGKQINPAKFTPK